MVTAFRTSDSVSKPSTNSPMMRSTRHGSVLVKEARRSIGTTCGGMRSCSSSVSGLRGEALGCSGMGILHVIEEGREADMPWPVIGDDAAGDQMPDGGGWIGDWDHHDGGPLRRIGSDFRLKPGVPHPGNEIFRQGGGDAADRRDADCFDVLEATELRVHRG